MSIKAELPHMRTLTINIPNVCEHGHPLAHEFMFFERMRERSRGRRGEGRKAPIEIMGAGGGVAHLRFTKDSLLCFSLFGVLFP